MKEYISALAMNYASFGLAALTQLLLIPMIMRSLGSEISGIYFVMLAATNFVAVGIGWIAGAAVKESAEVGVQGTSQRTQNLHSATVFAFCCYASVILLAAVILSIGVGRWWLGSLPEEVVSQCRFAVLLLGFYIWVSYIHQADLSVLTGNLQQSTANTLRFCTQLIFGISALVGIRFLPRLDFLVGCHLVIAFVMAIVGRWYLRQKWSIPVLSGFGRPDWHLIKKLTLGVGWSYFVFGIAQFALMYADTFFIAWLLGPEKVAMYVILWKVPEVMGTLLGRISETMSPFITRISARGHWNDCAELYIGTSRFQHLLAIIAAVFYTIFGPWILRWWVGPEHAAFPQHAYSLAALAMMFQVWNRHDVILHFALGKVHRLIVPQFLEMLCKFVIVFFLAPKVGVQAPFIAVVSIQLLGLSWWYRYAAGRLTAVGLQTLIKNLIVPDLAVVSAIALLLFCARAIWPETGFTLSCMLFLTTSLLQVAAFSWLTVLRGWQLPWDYFALLRRA